MVETESTDMDRWRLELDSLMSMSSSKPPGPFLAPPSAFASSSSATPFLETTLANGSQSAATPGPGVRGC